MRTFVDESGDFASNPPQISLHCAVIAPSSILVELYRRHLAWKVSILGQHRRRELKANVLTDAQLAGFMRDVIVPESALKVTMVGIDTALFTKTTIESWRDLLSKLCLGAAQWSGDHGFSIAERQYREMSGWVWNRSAENIALTISLGETIWKALQNTIIWFQEKQFEKEFEDLEIVIDRSFVRNPTHELFWREIFRTYSINRSRRDPANNASAAAVANALRVQVPAFVPLLAEASQTALPEGPIAFRACPLRHVKVFGPTLRAANTSFSPFDFACRRLCCRHPMGFPGFGFK